MKSQTILLLLFLAIITSCGPNKSDKLIQEAEKRAHDDSVKRVAENEMKLKLEKKYAISDSIVRIESEITIAKQAIGNAKAEYEVQSDKLSSIKGFKFLRSRGDREAQIRDQVKVIYDLESMKNELVNKLINLQVKLDYFNSEIRKYSDN